MLVWPIGTRVAQKKKTGRLGAVAQASSLVFPDQYLVRWDEGGEQWVSAAKLRAAVEAAPG